MRAARIAVIAVLAAGWCGVSSRPAPAMPVFAQAYGVKCNVCHTQVPALNTYGRYVQRTGYASLDPNVLRRALPVWWDQSVSYDSESGPPPRPEFGNMAIHAVGFIGNDVTYHFQQWILQDNVAGDLDTFWVTYNNLLHRDGHLFAGLIEAPGPSPYSQWMDLSGFTTPEITVGEHAYELDANRWGTKFNYIKGGLDLEAGYMYSGDETIGMWGQSTNFTNTDKTFQYKAAYDNPDYPLEAGVYGSRGSWPLAEGGFDQYWSVAPYVQRDPWRGVPGVLAIYQMALDGNPGYTSSASSGSVAAMTAAGLMPPAPPLSASWLGRPANLPYTAQPGNVLTPLGSAGSTAATLEFYEPVLNRGMISIRKEWTNDGLGTQNQTGNVDFNYQLARFLHAYVEEYFGSHMTPGWQYMLWWTTPISSVK